MKVTSLVRCFKYDGQTLPDPGAGFSPAQVKDLFTSNFPELVNAEIEGPNILDDQEVYTFKRTTGTKGLGAQGATVPFVQRLALVVAGQADPLQPRHQIALSEKLAATHRQFGRALGANQNSQRSETSRPATLPGLPSAALPLLL